MSPEEWKQIHGLAAMIEGAPRSGAPIDMPEGARLVKFTLSDTLATRITMAMRQCSGELAELEALRTTNKEQADALEILRNRATDIYCYANSSQVRHDAWAIKTHAQQALKEHKP